MRKRLQLAMLAIACTPLWSAAAPPAANTPRTEAPPHPEPVTPPRAEVLDAALRRGVAFLLKDQNKDGSWGTAERTKDLNIWAGVGSHHAFRTAVTALCVSALIESSGTHDDHADRAAVREAIERGEEYLLRELPRRGYRLRVLLRRPTSLPTNTASAVIGSPSSDPRR